MTKLDDAKQLFDNGDLDGALTAAAQAIGEDPLEAETYGIIGCIQTHRRDYYHAVEAFDRYYKTREQKPRAMADDLVLDGIIPILSCRVYSAVGRLGDAIKCQGFISPLAANDPAVNSLYFPIQGEVMRLVGMDRLQAMFEYFIWDTEPIKAMFFLEHCVPAAISDSPRVAEMKRGLKQKMRHLKGWEAYKAEYDAIPSETFHTAEKLYEFVHNLGRTKNVVAWAKSLPLEGPPVEVLGVGFQDGIIESDAMEQCDRIHLTVCDVSPHAGQGLQMLQAKFPGRVTHYQIKDNHYDWAPAGTHYDAIFIFEVLEHVPSDVDALMTLRALLKDDGVLFLSTPIAERWVEPYLTGSNGPTWYGHVRAHNPTSLFRLARTIGFDVGMDATDRGGVFFCRLKRGVETHPRKVSIYVPGTPLPFDPDSHLRGHLGGSEEAVLYLAPALFKHGFEVTVYAPRPDRDDHITVLARDSVQWRPVEDFDFSGDHERVLFWRCPQILNDPVVQAAKYKKYLWLHDAGYFHTGR